MRPVSAILRQLPFCHHASWHCTSGAQPLLDPGLQGGSPGEVKMTHLRLHFRVALCLPACAGLLLLAGCLSMRGGTPSPNSATAAEDCVDAETLNRIVAQLAEDDSVKPGGPRYNVLVLSTGG